MDVVHEVGRLTIGAVARVAGVGVSTVRFYERRGLLPRPPRTASGYRAFPAGAAQVVRFIRPAQRLAKAHGVNLIPAVVVDGVLADCRKEGVNKAVLRSLGVGDPG